MLNSKKRLNITIIVTANRKHLFPIPAPQKATSAEVQLLLALLPIGRVATHYGPVCQAAGNEKRTC